MEVSQDFAELIDFLRRQFIESGHLPPLLDFRVRQAVIDVGELPVIGELLSDADILPTELSLPPWRKPHATLANFAFICLVPFRITVGGHPSHQARVLIDLHILLIGNSRESALRSVIFDVAVGIGYRRHSPKQVSWGHESSDDRGTEGERRILFFTRYSDPLTK